MNELRFAFRQLRSAPVFTVTALATIAICLGANLARLEARVVLSELTRRVASFDVHADRAVRVHSVNVRGFASLPVTFTRRQG